MAIERNETEIADAGQALYRSRVVWKLVDEDKGKMVAIDVDSGDYEVDAVERKAVDRLLCRKPEARTWTVEFHGQPIFRMGWRATYGRLHFNDDATSFIRDVNAEPKND